MIYKSYLLTLKFCVSMTNSVLMMYIYLGEEAEILRRHSFFDDNILLNSSGPLVEHSSGSLIGEKSLFYDSGDGFGDEGAAGEMIGMLSGHIETGYFFQSHYYKVLEILFDQIRISSMFLCHIGQHIFYQVFKAYGVFKRLG